MGGKATLTPEQLRAVLARNSQISLSDAGQLALVRERGGTQPSSDAPGLGADTPKKGLRAVGEKKFKSRVEAEYDMMLARMLAAGEILAYDHEAVTLVIGDPKIRYTPDFFVRLPGEKVRLIEVKGPYMREDAVIKFKVARKQYPCFEFQFWQRSKDKTWTQLI